jgi:hypothetical protein
MPKGVRLVRWQPKPPPVRLSECSTVTDTEKLVRATLRQLNAWLHGKTWLSGNWGLRGLLDRLEACGCTMRLEDPMAASQSPSQGQAGNVSRQQQVKHYAKENRS